MAEWLVSSSGEVGVSLASLEPLKLGEGHLEQAVFPGQQAGLVADVQNPNPVALSIVSSSLKDGLHSNVPACQAGLEDIRYLDNNDVKVEPGNNDKTVLGRFVLPSKLPNACQGEKLTAEVQVKASYGS